MCIYRNSIFESPDFLVYTLHSISIIELPIHILGAYIILYRTPKEMKSVKPAMLNLHLWSAVLDFTYGMLVSPYVLIPMGSGIGMGLLSNFGIVITWMESYLCMSNVAVVSVAILIFFENRYDTLVIGLNRSEHRNKFRILYFCLNYLLSIVFLVPTFMQLPEPSVGVEHARKNLDCLPSEIFDSPRFLTIAIDVTVLTNSIALYSGLMFVQLGFFITLTIHYLAKSPAMSAQTRKLQKKFFLALCIQISVPLIVLFVPMFYVIYAFSAQYFNMALNNIVFICIAVHGLFSTIVMLLIHKPYRTASIEIISRVKYIRKPQRTSFVAIIN